MLAPHVPPPVARFAETAALSSPRSAGSGGLGFAVAVSRGGGILAAGAPAQAVSGHVREGTVYVFVTHLGRPGAGSQAAVLTAPRGTSRELFGISVAISADGATIAAGAQGATVSGRRDAGAVFVFRRPARGWSGRIRATELTASNATAGDALGTSVALSANGATVVTGAAASVGGDYQQGAAYVFSEPPGGWAATAAGGHQIHQVAELSASNGGQSDFLGYSVAISADGSTILAGAPFAAVTGAIGGQGAAYVFTRPASGWGAAPTQQQAGELTASDGVPGDTLGVSVGASGDGSTLAAGAAGATVSGHPGQGAAYVFVRPQGGWASGIQAAKLVDPRGLANDDLGASVAVSADGARIAAGAPATRVAGRARQGVVGVFDRPAAGWSGAFVGSELTAVHGTAHQSIGGSVALSASGQLAVGAPAAIPPARGPRGAAFEFAGAHRSSTALTVRCRPAPGGGAATSCRATVTATSNVAATGLVRFAIDTAGAPVGHGSCRLLGGGEVGSCGVTLRAPAQAARIAARYGGDSADGPSAAQVTIRARTGAG